MLIHAHICTPVLNENETIHKLISALEKQKYPNFTAWFCVNQPDAWWNIPEKRKYCENNIQMLAFLDSIKSFHVEVINRCSQGKGWNSKSCGIGMARKTVFDAASEVAKPDDILISMDADTEFGEDYIESVVSNISQNTNISALSVPYFHKLTGDMPTDYAMLRYEIYMRNYAINMLTINNPYAYTALGSAMALSVKKYKNVKGITPKDSGEDFYFLQKLRKRGAIGVWNQEGVYPASRFSDRVIFGTGPAMCKIHDGKTQSYPVFHHSLFQLIKDAYCSFNALFNNNETLKEQPFLRFQTHNINWEMIRKNNPDSQRFSRSCSEIFDGLKIYRFLKQNHNPKNSNTQNLIDNLSAWNIETPGSFNIDDVENPDIGMLSKLRDTLSEYENCLRYNYKYV